MIHVFFEHWDAISITQEIRKSLAENGFADWETGQPLDKSFLVLGFSDDGKSAHCIIAYKMKDGIKYAVRIFVENEEKQIDFSAGPINQNRKFHKKFTHKNLFEANQFFQQILDDSKP